VGSEQLLLINEFLYPRLEEFADIMPAALGAWMLRIGWVRRLVDRMAGHGKVLNTTSISGFSQLYLLAGLRRWRRRSLRFKREQQRITNWLSQLQETAAHNYELAMEVAECPRLVKGYGDTHLLGSRNFESLMNALPTLKKTPDGATHLKKLRELALADDTGKKLADALKELSL
jgi:indolepyruvate ferredoxin oxidoreductase beta subunit